MAVFEYSRSVREGGSLFNRASSFAYHITGAVVAWKNARQTRKELSRLSDRELADIGLSRSDIDSVR
ncbi:hypothetical protein DDZ14_16945 [Maritimibacter sp. 55A14]|uniref:DUF1127 domain-containing protein n=1 Tax=Maritimibacter sp. 55A14 TaxID=2174844 RepID=UPI000D612FC4|nr:DUF1127 domain-containing protein [Maritimibacter sp. 55A14]PWE29435.1 hypothetical protein DDZ14_16945 [Maritimibacter sp. 55A14]